MVNNFVSFSIPNSLIIKIFFLTGTKKPLITMTISKYNLQPITDFFQATFLIDPLESTFELQTLTIPDSNSSQADKIMN